VRLAILSDIHGSLPSLEAVLDDLQKQQPDHIIVAGDMVTGPNSVEVLAILQDLDCWMIWGNNENYILRFDSGEAPDWWYTSKQFGFVRWAFAHMDKASLDFIRSLPEQRVVEFDHLNAIRVVHGSPRNADEHLYPGYDPEPLKMALSQIIEPVRICGHTHIPWVVKENNRLAFNPGAICASINGNPDAHYAMLTWQTNHWEVEHHSISYDLNRLHRAYVESGLLEEGSAFAHVFLLTVETGKKHCPCVPALCLRNSFTGWLHGLRIRSRRYLGRGKPDFSLGSISIISRSRKD
jgi:putative phosphoesterase